jgi:predicted nucleic acid-binding protein
MTLFYVDSSTIVKLIIDERETEALRAYVLDADMVSCELALAEVSRAIQRAASRDADLARRPLLERAGEVLDAIAMLPLDRGLLLAAGALDEPALRTLDAIHIAAAIDLSPIDAFTTYDDRQAAAARLAGLRTASPGLGMPQDQE